MFLSGCPYCLLRILFLTLQRLSSADTDPAEVAGRGGKREYGNGVMPSRNSTRCCVFPSGCSGVVCINMSLVCKAEKAM